MQFHKIEKIEPSSYSGKVYNLEVENDHSYLTESLTVHNCDPSKADNKFFNIDRINKDLASCSQPLWIKEGVKQWAVYENHMRYTIGADTSEGIGKDSNAFTMWNTRTGEQVCSYHSNEIKPELFAYKFAEKGKEFGNCIVAPEINNYSGGIVITTLRGIYQEDKIFRHTDQRTTNQNESNKIGWYTTSLSKTNAFMEFRKDYNDGLIKVKDPDLLKEMKMYTEQDLSDTQNSSKITRHFDLLTSAIIGWYAKSYQIQEQGRVLSRGASILQPKKNIYGV